MKETKNLLNASSGLLSLLIIFFFATNSFAQFEVFPAERANSSATKKSNTAARSKAATLLLPFWDDFSTPSGLWPDETKWENSFHISVNDGMGINQPTINVATFDGLDSLGLAYNPTEILVTGYTDVLTSAPIDLSETYVTVAERPTVYLSFFFQWQGNGEAPDNDDYLQLDFKNAAGAWESILTIFPEDTFDRTVFYERLIQVSGDQFFHSAFQFRFRSFGRQSGPYDTWNLDYVYLNKNRSEFDNSYPERAAASSLTSLFGRYQAVPYLHFLQNRALTPVTFEVQNLKNSTTPVSINYRATADFTSYDGETVLGSYNTVLVPSEGVKGTSGIMFPLERTTVELSTLPDPNNTSQFNPDATGVDVTIKMKVISSDSIDDGRDEFLPFNLQVNDTVSKTFRLRDYYAYDDGVAEYSAGLTEPGSLIAYQFDKIMAASDKLIGFDIHFVPYGVTDNQTITFYIFRDDGGKPGTILETIGSQVIERKKLNEFQSIRWTPVTLIDMPRFYIGWKHPVAGKALVGLDNSNDTGDKMFVNSANTWYQNQVVKGSLMLRPVFGEGEVVVGIHDEVRTNIYPNPSKGAFYVNGDFDNLKIISSTGASLAFESFVEQGRTLIKTNARPGLYLVKIQREGKVATHKVIFLE